MKNQKIYLITGEFSKLCHTTKYTLFHYCDIGIFTPAYTDENGYRYYHVLQYDTFMTISELRAIGMSLAEIKEYLDERSPERMLELYNKQEQILNSKISQLKKLQKHICKQKEKINHVINCNQDYFIETQNQCFLSYSECIIQRDNYSMANSVGKLITNSDNDIITSGMICRLNDSIKSENYPFCFYVSTNSKQENTTHTKKAGIYLCTYHYGDYETMRDTFKKLSEYANKHNIKLDDYVYAETIAGDWAVNQSQDYIIKVYVKINDKI